MNFLCGVQYENLKLYKIKAYRQATDINKQEYKNRHIQLIEQR